MKFVDALLALLFLAFTIFQFNDPDPYVWAMLYGLVAAVAVLAFVEKLDRRLAYLAAAACLAALIWTAPGFFEYITQHASENILQDMSAERPYIEETREFGGAAMALVAMAFYIWRGRRPKPET